MRRTDDNALWGINLIPLSQYRGAKPISAETEHRKCHETLHLSALPPPQTGIEFEQFS
jgi:hypothetical protein